MSWVQVEFALRPALLDQVEDQLLRIGCSALTLLNGGEDPVLEPQPGEVPLWQEVKVQALFPTSADFAAVRECLASLLGNVAIDVQFLGDQDWQAAARTHAVNEVFADRLWLLPKEKPTPLMRQGLTPLYLEPGLAFGSGGHPTTRLCLQWLAQHVQAGQRVLDFGCGSGVLGIAAALLGAKVVAVDYDPQALIATRENAAYNGLTHTMLTIFDLAQWHPKRYKCTFDIVVANILATPLQDLAEEFETVAKPRAAIILSGVLPEQAEAVMDRYLKTRFTQPQEDQGWARLDGICG